MLTAQTLSVCDKLYCHVTYLAEGSCVPLPSSPRGITGEQWPEGRHFGFLAYSLTTKADGGIGKGPQETKVLGLTWAIQIPVL